MKLNKNSKCFSTDLDLIELVKNEDIKLKISET